MKIGDEVLIHGYIDEIRYDHTKRVSTVIIRNEGGYFGTVECEVTDIEMPNTNDVLDKIRAEIIELRSRQNVGVLECLDIINKYKAESDEQERVDDYRDRLDELEREEYYESKYGKEKE